jgi:hypothetical protein
VEHSAVPQRPAAPRNPAAPPGPEAEPGAALSAQLTYLEEEGVTLYELYAHGEGSAPLYASLGFAGDPALMRMTRLTARTGTRAS